MTFDPSTARPEEDPQQPAPRPTPRPAAFDPRTAVPVDAPPTREILRQALQTKPDAAAEADRLSRRYPAPYEVVKRNADDFQMFDMAEGLAAELDGAPTLAGAFKRNPRLAEMAHDDIGVLGKLSAALGDTARYMTSAPGTKRSLVGDVGNAATDLAVGATVGVGKGIFDIAAVLNDAIGWDAGAAGARQTAKRAGEAMASVGSTPESSTGSAVKSGLQSAGTNLAMLPIGLQRGLYATANQAATTVAALMGTSVGAGAYNEARDAGKGKIASAAFGIPQGVFEFVFEKIPAHKLFGDLANNAGLLQTLKHQAFSEVWTEQLTTLAQDFNEWMNMHPEKTLSEFIQERPEAAYQTLVATLVGVGVQTSTIHGINKIVEKASDQRLQFQQDAFEQMQKLAAQSALRERSPEQFRALVQQVVDANDTAQKSIHVDGQVLNQLSPDVLAQLPEAVRSQIPDAALANGTVEIPMADVLTVAPGTPLEQILNDHARMTPDAMSRDDAVKAGDQAQVLMQKAQDVIAQAQDQQAAQADHDAVKENIRQQLMAGNFVIEVKGRTVPLSPAVAEGYAAWAAAFFTTYGARMGMTAQEFYARNPLRVAGEATAPGQVMDQLGTPLATGYQSVQIGDTSVEVSVKDGRAEIGMVKTPEDKRGQGSARKALEQVLRAADVQGLTVTLTPEPMDRKTSKAKLEKFYKSLGFTPNKGKNKDFRYSGAMIRQPRATPTNAGFDQTQSEAFKRYSNGAPLLTSADAATHQFKTGEKIVVEAFHGTKRPDRVGTKFLKKRATSGPMAYHTSDPSLASSYASGKQDTSLSMEDRGYSNWFKVKLPGERSATDLVRSWYRLDSATKDKIVALAPRVTYSDEQEDDGGNKIVLGPEDHDSGLGSYDYNLAATRTSWDRRGNPLKALVEDWLYSGNLFNDEERFMQVLKLAGFPMQAVEYDSPTSEYPFVYKNYIAMQNPLVTSDVPQAVVDALNAAAKKDRSRAQVGGADAWDKNTRTLKEWVAAFNGEDNEYVWTSIPDKVTEVFRSLGYDGVVDWSGKGGGPAAVVAPVYIPFEETQVKSAIGNKGKFDTTKNDILRQDEQARSAAAITTDENGLPEIHGDGVFIGFGQPAERFEFIPSGDGEEMLNQAIMSPEGVYQGYVEATYKGGKPVAIYDIYVEPESRKQGVGERAVAAMLDASGGSLHISNVVPAAQGFWEKVGVPIQNVEEGAAYDGTITNEDFNASAAGQKRGRTQGDLGQNQGTSAATPRGTFNPATLELVLNPNANLSTFFHETGHFFLEVMADIASQPNAPAQIAADMGTFLKWAGVKDLATWNALDLEGKRKYHERWAESVEQYVMEGKAPSVELQPLMRRFSVWLKSVYGSIKAFLASRGQATSGGVLGQAPNALAQAKEDFADFDPLTDPDRPPYEGAKKHNGNWVSRDGNFTAYPTGGYGARVVSNHTAEFLDKYGFGSSHLNLFGIQIFEALERGQPFAEPQARMAAEMADLGVEDAQDEAANFVRQALRVLAPGNLKTWFGDSKIVDDEGAPLVVYHGTPKDFSVFKGGRFPGTLNDIGFWFSSEPADANAFARAEGANVMPVYLRIERPLYVDSVQELTALWKKHTGSDNFRTGAEAFKAWAESAGYDGVVFDGKDIDPSFAKGAYLVAFRPEQIKSAIGNDGTFDANDPRILSQDPNAQPGPPMALNDDIRRVMDRMLATDQQIAEANEVAGLLPDLEADGTAEERLRKRSMADLKWAVRARDAVIAKLRKQAAAIEKTIRAEVAVEVDQMPEMRAKAALDALNVNTEYDGVAADHKAARKAAEEAAKAEITQTLLEAHPDVKGLAKGQLLAKNKRDIANKVEAAMIKWDQANPKPSKVSYANEADVATVADSFGYESVDAMLQAIDAFGSKADAIDGMTQQRMLQEHGDLIDDNAIREAANEAVHNEARARSLATELRTQREMLNPRADTGEVNAKGSKITVNALVEAAKQFAANVVARTQLRDLKSKAWQHTAAERRASQRWQEATAAGKTQEAVQAKQDQMLNNAAAKAAIDAKAEMGKILEFFKRVTKGNDEKVVEKGRDPDIVNAARAVLRAYGIETATTKTADAYLEVLERNDADAHSVIAPMVQAALQNAQPIQALTFEELQALHEEIQAMWHLAKSSREYEVAGDKMDIDDAADELRARLEVIGIPDEIPGEKGALTKKDERARWLQFAGALLRRVEQWTEAMDGKFGGSFNRLLFQPIKDRANAYRVDKVEYRKKFQGLVDAVAPTMTHQLIAAPELGYTFGRGHNGIGHAELLHAILHTGNESNKRKLLLGRNWGALNADGTLDTSKWDAFIQRLANEGVLQKAHFDFAQGVWDLLEQTKPLAQKAHRDVFGRYFAEVTADPFVDPWGQARRGGYVPAQADPNIVADERISKAIAKENESMLNAFPTTNKGFTKGRVEYNRPLILDLRTIPQHIDKVLLFSHMEPVVRGVARVLDRPSVSQALNRIDPSAIKGMLTPWLQRSAKQIVETPTAGDGKTSRVLSTLRSRAGAALMFGNISNAIQQVSGFVSAFSKLKSDGLDSHMMRATAQMIAHPKQMREQVAQASSYMATRMDGEMAALTDAMNDILLNPSLYEKSQAWAMRNSYFLQSALDNVTGPVIWTAAYNAALEKGHSDVDSVRYADSVIRQTQGATTPEDVSRIETGPAYARIFSQFIGYFNMLANTNATALQQIAREIGLKKGAGKALGVVFFGMLAPIWVAEAIAQAFKGGPDDPDKDGYLDDWLAAVFGMGTIKGLLANVPFVAQLGQLVVNRFNKNPADDRMSLSPAVSLLESAASVPKDVYDHIMDKGNAQHTVRDVAALVSLATGLPAAAVARPVGYLAGVADNKISPTSAADAVRGTVTGVASPESKVKRP